HRSGGLPWFLAIAGHLARAQAMAEDFVSYVAGAPAGGLVISATGHARFGLGLVHAARGRPAAAREAFARARAIYQMIDHHAVIGYTLLSELRDVVLPYATTDIAERRRLAADAETALDLAAGTFPSNLSARRARLGLLFLEGGWDEACAIAEEVPEHGNYVLRREATNALGPIWLHRGRVDLLEAHVKSLLPQGPAAEPGSVVLLDGLLLQRLAAELALGRGDFSSALAWLEANDRWLDWSGAILGRAENRVSWARYCHALGDQVRASRHADAAIDAASQPRQPLALIAAWRMRGELALAAGDLETAERLLRQALDLAAACAAPFEGAITSLALAETHLGAQRRDDADASLRAARAILEPLRADAALHRADALAARLDVRPSPTEGPAGLTPREIEVLRLVAQGLTDADVGGRLFISPRTVSQHLRSIYNKLGVSSRAAATRFAVERDLA
ncbi:MAG TPA: LuxR C-terminal-related transcriptional regulator, partial [Thermomicrobiales bacterium]|nr:LuxR C-terminal-related transcriptional regulator [Thermomicrobiales bacterium]